MESKIVDILLHHGVKPTSNRIVVAKALSLAKAPLSQQELEMAVDTIDKSGISRTLALFKEHHLIHSIDNGSGTMKYELCHSLDHEHHDDEHVHFFCERCHRTICLEQTPVPPISLPEGFTATATNYVVKGICSECQKQAMS